VFDEGPDLGRGSSEEGQMRLDQNCNTQEKVNIAEYVQHAQL